MATTSVRWTIAKTLVDMLTEHPDLAGVQVESGWPGDTIRNEAIWIEALNGTEQVPYMTGGARVTTDDRFEIPLLLRVTNHTSNDDTMTRLTEMIAAVQDVVKNDPSLGIAPEDGMLETDLGEADISAGRFPEGSMGFARMVLSVYSRLF